MFYFFNIVRSRNNESFADKLMNACTDEKYILDYTPLNEPLQRLKKNSTIIKIYNLNRTKKHNIIRVTSLEQIIDETSRFLPTSNSSVDFGVCKIFPLVMYYDGIQIASHYFTLIVVSKDGEIIMYLYNSYGSENMQQPPFLRRITIDDFNEIIRIIGKLPSVRTPDDYDIMKKFFTKYFLGSSGLGVFPNDDQIDDGGLDRFEKIEEEEGRDMELAFLKRASSRSSSFGFITSIISQVSEAEKNRKKVWLEHKKLPHKNHMKNQQQN
jgi:hypothetical protein